MSSLIVAADLDLVMLEISIEELVVPRVSDFDSALMKKTIVMFRMLDKDWTSIHPQRNDYQIYRGSNYDREPFNGGVSVVFAMPQSSLESDMEKVDLQLHVRKELSKYFELQSCEMVGIACIDVTDLFNGVINRLRERNGRVDREPVAKSSKNTYQLVKEDGTESGAHTTVYLRLTHLGQTVISEIEVPDDPKLLFYAREETSDNLPYQFREINQEELTSGCWGSGTLIPPRKPKKDAVCCCDPAEGRKQPNDITNYEDFVDSNDFAKDTRKEEEADELGGGKDGKKETKKEAKLSDDKDGHKDAGIKRKVGNGGDGGNGKKKVVKKKEVKKKEKKMKEEEMGGETSQVEEVKKDVEKVPDDDEGAVSCLLKPFLCGREGTCNKKDKKGKGFGKCGRPDGEGGNPLACGEQRKCARRKMAAGSATVGIVDKKIQPCPPVRIPNCCPCPTAAAAGQIPWSRYDANVPCARCQINSNRHHAPIPEINFCRHYENGRFHRFEQPGAVGCSNNMQVGWR